MTNWLVAPFGQEIYSVFESRLPYISIYRQVSWQSGNCGVLLILFFRGSIPFGTLIINIYKRVLTNMLKLVNNLLLSRSGIYSLRVRVSLFVISYFSVIVFPKANQCKGKHDSLMICQIWFNSIFALLYTLLPSGGRVETIF